MQSKFGAWTLVVAMGAFGAPACVTDNDSGIEVLELVDEDDAAAPSHRPASGDLTTQRRVDAFPGFPVDIATDGDDIVLTWTSVDPSASVMVLRSSNAQDLVDPDLGALPASVSSLTLTVGSSMMTDPGAAARQTFTPNYFYRVVYSTQSGPELSTMVMKTTTAVHPGFNKFGLCMLGGVEVASDVVDQFGSAVNNVYSWNAGSQSWLYWMASAGDGPHGDFSLPYGGVVAVELNPNTDPYLSLVGTVPTSEPFEVDSETGLNLQTFPVLYDGPTDASYFVDQAGYWGIGRWLAQSQQRSWYWGSGQDDFTLEACQPYYVQLPPSACDSDAECNDEQYCRFDEATSCGAFGSGTCEPIKLGAPDIDAPVCGCDGMTYSNEHAAAAAGVSVASQGACEGGGGGVPGCNDVFYADADADGFGDPNVTEVGCAPPAGFVDNADDCDDTDPDVSPSGFEIQYDMIDNDCNPGTLDAPTSFAGSMFNSCSDTCVLSSEVGTLCQAAPSNECTISGIGAYSYQCCPV
ncbi:MAG: MopE-related protein [Myxococcota bacterium]